MLDGALSAGLGHSPAVAEIPTATGLTSLQEGRVTCYIDRDSKFTTYADGLLHDAVTRAIRLPVRSPNLNAYAERWVRTVREECLDRVIVLNERHLRWVLIQFVRYYNKRRPHRSLHLRPPDGPVESLQEGEVFCRKVFGGLINDYYRKAA